MALYPPPFHAIIEKNGRKEQPNIMNFHFIESAKEHILVVAHRGVFGGNIPCNTLVAYEIALKQGADVIEIDVEMSKDGKLYIMHPGAEEHQLSCMDKLRHMTSEEIARQRYLNYDRLYTQFGVNTLDEVLETFRGRCYINVDKFWGHPKEIYQAIKRHQMTDQVVVKSAPSEEVFQILEELAPDIPYLPVVRDTHSFHERLKRSAINYIGAEVLFRNDDVEVASPEFTERMHRDGKLVWVNSIIYNYKEQLAGGHSDDTSLIDTPDNGWGWLARRGYDMIQTDWTHMLIDYLKQNNLYYRN